MHAKEKKKITPESLQYLSVYKIEIVRMFYYVKQPYVSHTVTMVL